VTVRPLVLIADDDPDILELVSLTLERDGYEVATARNGEEALQIAAERQVHLAVLDFMMPGIDGDEVARRLREADGEHRLPILILSAFAEDRQAARALAVGSRRVHAKAVQPARTAGESGIARPRAPAAKPPRRPRLVPLSGRETENAP
jgi:CheY-like chemotaxis protein